MATTSPTPNTQVDWLQLFTNPYLRPTTGLVLTSLGYYPQTATIRLLLHVPASPLSCIPGPNLAFRPPSLPASRLLPRSVLHSTRLETPTNYTPKPIHPLADQLFLPLCWASPGALESIQDINSILSVAQSIGAQLLPESVGGRPSRLPPLPRGAVHSLWA